MSSNTNPEHVYSAPGVEGVKFDHPLTVRFAYPTVDGQRIAVAQGERRKKIAICSFASSSRHLMPFQEPDWEIWAMNQFYRHIPRLDREFDIHLNWLADNVPGTDHPKWLSEFPGPVYMADPPDSLPTAIRYPLARMIGKFSDYFTSTVAFMVALAIDEIDQMVEARASTMDTAGLTCWQAAEAVKALYGEHTIGIFGIDLIVGTEYFEQKACVESLIGEANARGITIALPPQTALMKQRWRYGYEADLTGNLLGIAELETRQAALSARKNAVGGEFQVLQGRKLERDELLALPAEGRDEALAARAQAQLERVQHVVAELQTLDGALQESAFYHQIIELRSRGGVIPMPTVVSEGS